MLQIDEHIVKAFFKLVKAGLFPVHGEGVMVHDSLFKDVDWEKVCKQSFRFGHEILK